MLRHKLAEFVADAQVKFWAEETEKAAKVGRRYKPTQLHFARWLGMYASSLSEVLTASREPSERTVHIIAKKLPEVYDFIGKPEWRARAGILERKQRRLERLARMAAKLNEPDLAKLEALARSLHPPEDGEGDSDQRPFLILATE